MKDFINCCSSNAWITGMYIGCEYLGYCILGDIKFGNTGNIDLFAISILAQFR